jgi:cytidylate kinase
LPGLTEKRIIIAIDGPAASGKSTTARLVAERLGYLYIDTGAMYRAVTLKMLQQSLSPTDVSGIAALLDTTEVHLIQNQTRLKVFLDGADVTEAIRSQEVTGAVSAVSSIPVVREAMVKQQRKMGESGGVVLDGRDIGTVVFPNADLKIFLIANVEERARRRQRELVAKGTHVELGVLMREIAERDRKDSTRETSPLRKADDAIELDTSNLTIEEQVEFVLQKARMVIYSI